MAVTWLRLHDPFFLRPDNLKEPRNNNWSLQRDTFWSDELSDLDNEFDEVIDLLLEDLGKIGCMNPESWVVSEAKEEHSDHTPDH